MRISPESTVYKELAESISLVIAKNGGAQTIADNYTKQGLSETRLLWDVFHAIGGKKYLAFLDTFYKELRCYDSHIESALRRIAKECNLIK